MRRNKGIYFGAFLLLTAGAPVALRPLPVNPSVDPGKTIQSQLDLPIGVNATFRRACYDCHSDETNWPWYSRLPLAGDAVREDVRKGRMILNFSRWKDQAGKTPKRAAVTLMTGCRAIQNGRMPKKEYLWAHPNAKLQQHEVQQLCQWTESLLTAARKPQ